MGRRAVTYQTLREFQDGDIGPYCFGTLTFLKKKIPFVETNIGRIVTGSENICCFLLDDVTFDV